MNCSLGSGEIRGILCGFKSAVLPVLGSRCHSWSTVCIRRLQGHQPSRPVCINTQRLLTLDRPFTGRVQIAPGEKHEGKKNWQGHVSLDFIPSLCWQAQFFFCKFKIFVHCSDFVRGDWWLYLPAGMLTRPEVAEAEAKIAFNFSAKFYILIPFTLKNKIFCRFSTELKKFWLKTGFNLGTLSVNTPKTTSYAFGRRLLVLCLHTE